MSRHNKVNKTNYVQAGRLTPDDMARERMKQAPPAPASKHPKMERQRNPARTPDEASEEDSKGS
jgi:hypothetical protein